MLISVFLVISSLVGQFCVPIEHLRGFSSFVHEGCLRIAPSSVYREEYQSLVCGAKLLSQKSLLQSSGFIHLFFIYGFQIYLAQIISKRLFANNLSRVTSLFIFVALILSVTAFHPSSMRAAIGLFLRETSSQKKLFWSPLQIAIFSGFFCVGLEPGLIQNYSLLISWIAAISFGFFSKYQPQFKVFAIPIVILPVLSGMAIPHPILSFIFSIFSQPILFIIFPLSVLSFIMPKMVVLLDLFWQKAFSIAEFSRHILSPVQLNEKFSFIVIWFYLLMLITLFLFLENKKLRDK